MKDLPRARSALKRAEAAEDDVERSLWLARAADLAIDATAVLVGGAATNLYTEMYVPTDIDMCAYLDESDCSALIALGLTQIQGDHFEYVFGDGQRWLIEFPDTTVDGNTVSVRLAEGEYLRVISLASLIVDRVLQSTDGTTVTFDEAVRLVYATFDRVDFSVVEAEIRRRSKDLPEITGKYEAVMEEVARLRGATGSG